jgi:hypothetical protein
MTSSSTCSSSYIHCDKYVANTSQKTKLEKISLFHAKPERNNSNIKSNAFSFFHLAQYVPRILLEGGFYILIHAARVVLGLKKYGHISEGLRSLKWLNVRDTLSLNDAVMVHKCFHAKLFI